MIRSIPKINCTVEDLTNDIRRTKDPLKLTILEKFLELKINQMRAEKDDDPSIDGLSDDSSDGPSYMSESVSREQDEIRNRDQEDEQYEQDEQDDDNDDEVTDEEQTNKRIIGKKVNKGKVNTKNAARLALKKMMKQQKNILSEFDRANKVKAYVELIEDDKKEKDKKMIQECRGKNEKYWETHGLYDEKYSKYAKDDTMNNKMMERLNSEIGFRLDDNNKMRIVKPFDDGDDDDMDTFARYDTKIPGRPTRQNITNKKKRIQNRL